MTIIISKGEVSTFSNDKNTDTPESDYYKFCQKSNANCGKSIINEKSDGTISIVMCPSVKQDCAFRSCNEIKDFYPLSPSGYYDIVTNDGSTINVYCYMEGDNCNINGLNNSTSAWTRLAHFNMSEPGATCPNELTSHDHSNIDHPVCGKPVDSSFGCISFAFPSNGQTFSNVCGQMRGYQYHAPDGFYPNAGVGTDDINQEYVDGYSITYGSPRKHIWTYAAGLEQTNTFYSSLYLCPCASRTDIPDPPSFVGSDYYCESGLPIGNMFSTVLYADDPLWDGEDCDGEEGPCCNPSNMPWFSTTLDTNTSDDIEVRLCTSQGTSNEDIQFDILELYIN